MLLRQPIVRVGLIMRTLVWRRFAHKYVFFFSQLRVNIYILQFHENLHKIFKIGELHVLSLKCGYR